MYRGQLTLKSFEELDKGYTYNYTYFVLNSTGGVDTPAVPMPPWIRTDPKKELIELSAHTI